MLRLLRNRDFRLLWLGGLISMIGDWALIAALPFEMYRRTGSALATGTVFVAGVAPAIIFGSTAGVVVDRWDRRRLMVLANIGLALVLLPLFALDLTGIWVVYAVLLASSVLEQLFVPAEVALLPQLVGQEHLVGANSLSSLNRNLARLTGPAVGGIAIAAGGLDVAVAVDIASFVLAAALIWLIGSGRSFRAAQTTEEQLDATAPAPVGVAKLVAEWRDGISIATSHPMLRAILIFTAVTAVGEGFLVTLLVPWMTDILHGDQYAWAALLSMQAVGGLVGAVFVGQFLSRVRPALLLGVGTLIFALIDLAIFVYPLVLPIVLPALIGMVVVGIPISAMGVGSTTLQQSLTSDSHRGRIAGLIQALSALGLVIGVITAGIAAPTAGIIPVMSLDSLLYFACGLMILATASRLRRREQRDVGNLEPDAA